MRQLLKTAVLLVFLGSVSLFSMEFDDPNEPIQETEMPLVQGRGIKRKTSSEEIIEAQRKQQVLEKLTPYECSLIPSLPELTLITLFNLVKQQQFEKTQLEEMANKLPSELKKSLDFLLRKFNISEQFSPANLKLLVETQGYKPIRLSHEELFELSHIFPTLFLKNSIDVLRELLDLNYQLYQAIFRGLSLETLDEIDSSEALLFLKMIEKFDEFNFYLNGLVNIDRLSSCIDAQLVRLIQENNQLPIPYLHKRETMDSLLAATLAHNDSLVRLLMEKEGFNLLNILQQEESFFESFCIQIKFYVKFIINIYQDSLNDDIRPELIDEDEEYTDWVAYTYKYILFPLLKSYSSMRTIMNYYGLPPLSEQQKNCITFLDKIINSGLKKTKSDWEKLDTDQLPQFIAQAEKIVNESSF